MQSRNNGRAAGDGLPPIDFGRLAAALLDRAEYFVSMWLPAGTLRNGRWYVGDFDGAPGESANVNLTTGTWIDNAGGPDDRGGDLISLYARIRGLNNGQAARELMRDLGWEVRQPPAAPPVAPQAEREAPAHASAADAQPARADRWRPLPVVPTYAPEPKRFRMGFKNKRTGEWEDHEAVRVWRWVFDGRFYGFTARFERIDSHGELQKDVLPYTWCEDTTDTARSQGWRWKQWAAPRPLYVPAGRLCSNPALAPVVLVEGEKCALAGHELFGEEFDFVTWPGGGKAWTLADWSWLRGRVVYLWPDADAQREGLTRVEREAGVDPSGKPLKPLQRQPGYQTMVGIGSKLMGDLGCTVFMVNMPAPGDRTTDGWDIADAIAQGWTREQVRGYIRASLAFVPPDDATRAKAGASTPTGAAADGGEGAAAEVDAWRRHLLTSDKGAVKAVRENVVLALDGWPEKGCAGIAECADLIRFNAFTNNVEKTRETPWGTPAGAWLECDELLMGDWLVREYRLPSMARMALVEAVLVVAHRHRFHPLRERVEGLRGRWKGGPSLLDTWLERVCLEEDEHAPELQEYLKLAGRYFVMGMVARVMTERRRGAEIVVGPGCKFDYMLVFEGPQGYGKSTVAKILGGQFFADTGLDINHKDSLMNIQGIWVYEWSELESLTKQEVGAVKRFVSSSEDTFRATFDKRPAKYPRQVVFFGTTNEQHYLMDTTGNRRFWPVRVTRPPDTDWLRAHVEELLAEAVARVDAGESFYPDRDTERRLFFPQQKARTIETGLESALRDFLYNEHQVVPVGGRNGTLINEIQMRELLACLGYSIDKQTDAVTKKAGQLLHSLEWTVRRASADDDGKRPRVYVRPRRDGYRRDWNGGATPPAQRSGSMDGRADGLVTTEDLDGPPF